MQVSWALMKALPLPPSFRGDQAGLFIINIVMGLVCIFVKWAGLCMRLGGRPCTCCNVMSS